MRRASGAKGSSSHAGSVRAPNTTKFSRGTSSQTFSSNISERTHTSPPSAGRMQSSLFLYVGTPCRAKAICAPSGDQRGEPYPSSVSGATSQVAGSTM